MSRGLVSRWATDDDVTPVNTRPQSAPESTRHKDTTRPNLGFNGPKSGSKVPKSAPHGILESRWAEDPAPKPSKGRSKHSQTHNKHNLQEDHATEKLPPMSEAGMSFAARLGNGPKSQKHIPKRAHQKPEPEEFREPEHSQNSESDSELPPMSAAGQSLAARLGTAVPSNTSQPRQSGPKQNQTKQTHDNKKTKDFQRSAPDTSKGEELPPLSEAGQSLASRLGIKPSSAPAKGSTRVSGKYVPPKKQEELKKQTEVKARKEAAAKKAEDEKLKYQKEMEKLVKEMEDSNLDWADIED